MEKSQTYNRLFKEYKCEQIMSAVMKEVAQRLIRWGRGDGERVRAGNPTQIHCDMDVTICDYL